MNQSRKHRAGAMKHPALAASGSIKVMDRLVDLVWYLSWVAAFLAAAMFIAVLAGYSMDNLHVRAPLHVSYFENGDNHEWIDFADRPAVVSVTGNALVSVRPPVRSGIWIRFPFVALLMVFLLVGVFYLRGIVKTLMRGDPFDAANGNRIRMIGIIAMLTGPVMGLGMYIQSLTLLRSLRVPGAKLSASLDVHPGWIILGLVFLVIAGVFDAAARIQREQDLTI